MKISELQKIKSSYGEVCGDGLWAVLREVEYTAYVSVPFQLWNTILESINDQPVDVNT